MYFENAVISVKTLIFEFTNIAITVIILLGGIAMSRKIYAITCMNCGSIKETVNKNQKFCCHECSVKFREKKKRKIINGVMFKQCSICKKFYPMTTEYFSHVKKGDGFHCNCKECENKRQREKYRTDEKYRKKRNSVPKEIKKIRRRNYYLKNKEKEINRAKKYNFENREIIKEREKAYRKTEKGIEENKIKCMNRRNKIKVSGKITLSDWNECKNFFRNSSGKIECAYCGKELERPTIEHFIPISKGGTGNKDNILPICRHCNCSKQDKDFYEWYKDKEFFDEKRIHKIKKYFSSIKTIPSQD